MLMLIKNTLFSFFYKSLFLIFCHFLFSCEPKIENIFSGQDDVNLVVEGEINNLSEPYSIKISLSNAINSPDPGQTISGLQIFVEEQAGDKVYFEETAEKGVYATNDTTFQGSVSGIYHLNIESKSGEMYQSTPQILKNVPSIDTLYYRTVVRFFPDIDSIGIYEDKFFASIQFKDQPGESEYYRWKLFVNGKYSEKAESIYLENDQLFNGKLKTIVFSSDTLEENDEIIIQQFSISKSSYEFWSLLKTQATNLGTPFSPPPALIEGNIQNLQNPDEIIIGHFDVNGKTFIEGRVIKP